VHICSCKIIVYYKFKIISSRFNSSDYLLPDIYKHCCRNNMIVRTVQFIRSSIEDYLTYEQIMIDLLCKYLKTLPQYNWNIVFRSCFHFESYQFDRVCVNEKLHMPHISEFVPLTTRPYQSRYSTRDINVNTT